MNHVQYDSESRTGYRSGSTTLNRLSKWSAGLWLQPVHVIKDGRRVRGMIGDNLSISVGMLYEIDFQINGMSPLLSLVYHAYFFTQPCRLHRSPFRWRPVSSPAFDASECVMFKFPRLILILVDWNLNCHLLI